MKTKRLLFIDRLLGIFVAFPLNFLVRLVGKITRFDHSLTKEMNKIVICKYKGMGSIIQATPLLATLRNRYPNAKIVFVSSKENKGILDKIHLIDEIYLLNDSGFLSLIGSSLGLIRKLIRFRADLYIDLEIYSNYSSIITTVSLAKDRFGYYLRSNQYRMGMYTHMMYFNTKAPISNAYLQFAHLLGIMELHEDLICIEQGQMLELPVLPKNYYVINPNASDLRYERRWPKESFIALIQKLRSSNPNLELVLIGNKVESLYVAEIMNNFKEDDRVHDLSGKTNLNQLIEVLRNADLVITNDTGPMHLASSLGTKVLALFGPCSPEQYGLGINVKALYKNVYCSPCVHEFVTSPCKGNNQCMKLISISEVYNAVVNYQFIDSFSTILYTDLENQALGIVKR